MIYKNYFIVLLLMVITQIGMGDEPKIFNLDLVPPLCNGNYPSYEYLPYLDQIVKMSAEKCSDEELADARKEMEILKKNSKEAREELDKIYNRPVIDIGEFSGLIPLTPTDLKSTGSLSFFLAGSSVFGALFFNLSAKADMRLTIARGWILTIGMIASWVGEKAIADSLDAADQYSKIIKKFEETNITKGAEFRDKLYLSRENINYLRFLASYVRKQALEREEILNKIQSLKNEKN